MSGNCFRACTQTVTGRKESEVDGGRNADRAGFWVPVLAPAFPDEQHLPLQDVDSQPRGPQVRRS